MGPLNTVQLMAVTITTAKNALVDQRKGKQGEEMRLELQVETHVKTCVSACNDARLTENYDAIHRSGWPDRRA